MKSTTEQTQIILEKTYTAEEIVEVDDDIHWSLNESNIPVDKDGFHEGTFEVVVTWVSSKSDDFNESEEPFDEYDNKDNPEYESDDLINLDDFED